MVKRRRRRDWYHWIFEATAILTFLCSHPLVFSLSDSVIHCRWSQLQAVSADYSCQEMPGNTGPLVSCLRTPRPPFSSSWLLLFFFYSCSSISSFSLSICLYSAPETFDWACPSSPLFDHLIKTRLDPYVLPHRQYYILHTSPCVACWRGLFQCYSVLLWRDIIQNEVPQQRG